jgi:hypothetical protein
LAGCFPGTANTQQFDINGNPLIGALLTVFQGGTTTPAATFQDIGLTIPATNPLVADASGRLPLFFVQDGSYALRLTDQFGIQSNGGFFYPQIPSIGASSSGGGGTPVDPTTVAQTGDVKWRLEQSTIAGWVRVNGRTVGNASSGASERANADTQALFIYTWQTYPDAICPVVGGRGAGALADFNAGKQITLLDARGRSIFGLDDMGNAALGAFNNVPFQKGNQITGGSSAGINATTLAATQIPPISSVQTAGFNVSVTSTDSVVHGPNTGSAQAGGTQVTSADSGSGAVHGPLTSTQTIPAGTVTSTSNNTGGQAFPMVPSALLATLFVKL